jgi:hypothetical protein
VLTGEIKLPYRQNGGSPYNAAVVKDARGKASRAKAHFFFTWNVNEFVLWETKPARTTWREQNYRSWEVTRVHRESHMLIPSTIHAIQIWLPLMLNEFALILRGTAPIGFKSPDEKFIEALESSLHLPILLNLDELEKQYKKTQIKSQLDCWMRDEQGWVIYDDPEGIRDNLERASKFACYALVNKLVFHEALLKRYGAKMGRLIVPDHIDTREKLRLHIVGYFDEAKSITGDYETVFGEDHKSIGNRIPFYSDSAVPHWRELINQIHEFDFSKLDYEVIGKIFERLISPEERHKYGQFYTRVEIVDLINSFCIINGDEKVMDPACGGGTFLVRAYARKRELLPTRKHGELLSDLYGADISHFATHLTTINLATRDLIDDENYPQIVRSDFFDIRANKTFVYLPKHVKAKGLGEIQQREVAISPLNAVIGNPPYIRQEQIPKSKNKSKPAKGTKEHYLKLTKEESSVTLSGRSDIHCYFWPHAASFLKNDGYLCLLTSSQWLDVEYGFRLQSWILRNFEIVAIFESFDEPWFVGARVATTVTILRQQSNEKKRMRNAVKFVQLRRPVAELLAHDGTTAGAVFAADALRDEILSLKEGTVNDRYRARVIKQGDLWNEGVRLGVLMGKSEDVGDDDPESQTGEYYGGKWGVYLRAPDLWFELMDEFGARFVPLGEVADIRFGVKSGKDCFFFPIDCSDEALSSIEDPEEFEVDYGVPRKEVKSGKVKLVKCGKGRGEIRPIESRYLEPEVHSLMEIDGFTVSPENCSRMILLVGKPKKKLKGQYVLDYINWGESQNIHAGPTCASRVTEDRNWYDLTGHNRGDLFWPKAQQYKHSIPLNENQLQCNCNLYDLTLPAGIDALVMGGILNSSLTVLSKLQYGRPVGVEGTLKTEVIDVKIMLVPTLKAATPKVLERIKRAFQKMKDRKVLQFLSERRLREMAYIRAGKEDKLDDLSNECEMDMADRRELDDAVIELLGVRTKKRRKELIDELYARLGEFFELTRQKEEKAIIDKNKAKRRGPAKPSEIAEQIYLGILDTAPHLLRKYNPGFIDRSRPFDTFEIPADGKAEVFSDMFTANGVRFIKGKKKQTALIETQSKTQVELLVLLAQSGARGFVRIPHEQEECQRVLLEYEKFIRRRDKQLRQLIEDRTSDEELQEKIHSAIVFLLSSK